LATWLLNFSTGSNLAHKLYEKEDPGKKEERRKRPT